MFCLDIETTYVKADVSGNRCQSYLYVLARKSVVIQMVIVIAPHSVKKNRRTCSNAKASLVKSSNSGHSFIDMRETKSSLRRCSSQLIVTENSYNVFWTFFQSTILVHAVALSTFACFDLLSWKMKINVKYKKLFDQRLCIKAEKEKKHQS